MSLRDDAGRLEDWLALVSLPGIGPHRAQRLLSRFDPASLRRAPVMQQQAAGLSAAQIAALHATPRGVADIRRWLEGSPARHVLSCQCPAYPEWLRQIPAPPVLLYVEGDPAVLASRQIAMVGTRVPTPGGADAARWLVDELVPAGLVITSGLALGIDTLCHQQCLLRHGQTVAVLGSGLANCYPRRNRGLATDILASGGVLVSELPPDTPPLAENFPRRNRIISGLALGTVVVEASLRSGSLITARYALEQGREVFAVPGSIHNPAAAGCLHLIQQGAKLVANAADILEELQGQWRPRLPASLWQPDPAQAQPVKQGPVQQEIWQQDASLLSSALLDNVGYDATATDVIVQRSGLPVGEVMSELLELELTGQIVAVPGGYARARRD